MIGYSGEHDVDDLLSLHILPRLKELMEYDTGNSIKVDMKFFYLFFIPVLISIFIV